MQPTPTVARVAADGHQVVEVVVDGGYRPQAIVARTGKPLEIVFDRRDDDPYSERVVFSSPRIDRWLRRSGRTTVVLPAQPPGKVRFTCAMGRYRGLITFQGAAEPRLARLRAEARRLDGPLGTAAVLWLCSLPLIALVSILALDPTAALFAAAFALLAWVVGCRWAFGDLRRPSVPIGSHRRAFSPRAHRAFTVARERERSAGRPAREGQ